MLAMSQQNTYYFEVIQAILVLRVQFLTLRNVTSCGEYMKRHKLPEANYLSFRNFFKRRLFPIPDRQEQLAPLVTLGKLYRSWKIQTAGSQKQLSILNPP